MLMKWAFTHKYNFFDCFYLMITSLLMADGTLTLFTSIPIFLIGSFISCGVMHFYGLDPK